MRKNFDMRKSLENRQENLIFLLKNKKEMLELEKQHQIYGAIKEIDYILHVMKYAQEEEEDEEESTSTQPAITQSLTQVEENQRKFKIPLKLKFERS